MSCIPGVCPLRATILIACASNFPLIPSSCSHCLFTCQRLVKPFALALLHFLHSFTRGKSAIFFASFVLVTDFGRTDHVSLQRCQKHHHQQQQRKIQETPQMDMYVGCINTRKQSQTWECCHESLLLLLSLLLSLLLLPLLLLLFLLLLLSLLPFLLFFFLGFDGHLQLLPRSARAMG